MSARSAADNDARVFRVDDVRHKKRDANVLSGQKENTMRQFPGFNRAFRFVGLLAIVTLGLMSIIATGGSNGGGGSSADTQGPTFYRDMDGDGYGDAGGSLRNRTQPQGYVIDKTDCDDADPAVNPGVAEICGDVIDNNCDGRVNEGCACSDADRDGYYAQPACGTAVDCDDADPAVYPGAAEICGDGLDNNCDGRVDDICGHCTDADGDGYYIQSDCGRAVDCDDADPTVYPGAEERCGNGVDNDCDGEIDENCPYFPDTGQTACYNVQGTVMACPAVGTALYGQDACYTINPPSYTKLDAAGNALPDEAAAWTMVRDNVTGLIWEAKTDDGGIHDRDNRFAFFNVADLFIDRLNDDGFGGYSDWRMPTTLELVCLLDYGTYGPTIETAYFPQTMSSYYLSFLSPDYSMIGAGRVSFLTGQAIDLDNADTFYVRAVRGQRSGASFVHNGDGTITDRTTGLTWSGLASLAPMTWQEALAWCEHLSLFGYTDWRLPDVKELASLLKDDAEDPAIDTAFFTDAELTYYWSSTTSSFYPDEAWTVSFSHGGIAHARKGDIYHVRPVRDWKK